MELKPGMRVTVPTSNGGSFAGTVEALTTTGSQALIRPESEDVRRFIGGEGLYALGSAHWSEVTES